MPDFMPYLALENFEVLKPIGAGGAGRVYLAKQTNLDRLVAIKVIKKSRQYNDDLFKRGLIEAKILAKLDHPNIVSIYDVGEKPLFFYMVIEYVNGGSLHDQILRSKKINELEIWQIISQVCRGLQSALAEGVIHRDVKPANILLSGKRYAKIGDFGISKVIEDESKITKEGSILGTPNFISPETAQLGVNDFRSDLYSLGVTIYFCLTKKMAFDGDNVMQILFQHANELIDAPMMHNPFLSPDANLIVGKLLQKKPENRYHSYGDLLVDIENILHKKKLTYASVRDAQLIYKPNQIQLFATKTRRHTVTQRIVDVMYNAKIAFDNAIIVGTWDINTRSNYITKQAQLVHYMNSFTEVKMFLEQYHEQKNIVVIDVDHRQELSVDIFTLLRSEFPETNVLFVTADEIEASEEQKQYLCTYEETMSRLSQNLAKVKDINFDFIARLAKEKSWSFDLEIEDDGTINEVNIKHGDICNMRETREIVSKKNTTWRLLRVTPPELSE
ncbi:serine/threonine protein kinase [Candidatus Uabimicrobium amorphum]|uniref:Serine/threonine-protein kinase PknB n=1 Tax=Uabimicrobium amorphum TaxID=2596890 RepID=A0A5S9IM41_UABAM|nr:serine/threonine-protein kinase [Candidatus Uabimicrobium amorphum]BBM83956.1 serine/threonine-protein kinase PknB [Candidatus Uabimicrobium amorphum]